MQLILKAKSRNGRFLSFLLATLAQTVNFFGRKKRFVFTSNAALECNTQTYHSYGYSVRCTSCIFTSFPDAGVSASLTPTLANAPNNHGAGGYQATLQ